MASEPMTNDQASSEVQKRSQEHVNGRVDSGTHDKRANEQAQSTAAEERESDRGYQ